VLLELLIAITLSGEVRQNASQSGELQPDMQEPSSQNTVLPECLQLQARTDYRVSPVQTDEARDQSGGADASKLLANAERKNYLSDVRLNIGCPYYNYAQYLTGCRPDKRQSAWKRIVKEDGLFFDKKGIRQFEAISRKHAFL
jgi:hypothetical protein